MKPVSKVPNDADGVRLKKGDPVVSTERYDDHGKHRGAVVGTLRGLVEVRHGPGCCPHLPAHRTTRAAAFLWRRAPSP